MGDRGRLNHRSFLARSKRAQALARAADVAVRGLETLEGRTLLSTSVPISWEGQVRAAAPDEWVVKFSDSYLEQSRKAARHGVGDEDLGPFVTLSEGAGYGVSGVSVERVRENPTYAIIHAPFAKADSIRKWAAAFIAPDAFTHRPASFESVSPYFSNLVIPSVTAAPAVDATGPGVNVIRSDANDPNLVEIEWAGMHGLARKGEWSVTFSEGYGLRKVSKDLSQTALVTSLADFGVQGAGLEHTASASLGHLVASFGQEAAIRRWADAAPEVIAFSPMWVGDPVGPAAAGGPDPEALTVKWNGQSASAAKGQWSVTFTSRFTSDNPGNDLSTSAAFQSLAQFGIKNARLIRLAGGSGAYIGRLYAPTEQADAIKQWAAANSADVSAVSPDWMMQISALPNDPLLSNQWALNNTGQTLNGITGTAGDDISASEAWDNTTGDSRVVVAVVDNGVKYTHPDLSGNMWSGIGYDTHDVDSIPYSSSQAHGTHVAGIIGAQGNNSLGVSGVAQDVQLMAIKVFSDTGVGTLTDLANGINYVIGRRNAGVNVRVINISSGGAGLDSNLTTAINNAESAGILVVAAAGNAIPPSTTGTDNDSAPFYPASYTNANVISVAATTSTDTKATYSNYGHTSVDLGAPGDNIDSTWVYSAATPYDYAYIGGTSMAAPMVAGAAALVISAWPSATVADVRAAILNHVHPDSNLTSNTVTGGRLDAAQALRNEKLLATAADNAVAYSGGNVHLAYRDKVSGHLMYVKRNSSGFWSAPVLVDDLNTSIGYYVSIAIDGSGSIGLAYYDASSADLRYAYSTTGTSGSWTKEIVHSASVSGYYPSLKFDSSNNPAISYYRAASIQQLWFAERSSGLWNLSQVDASSADIGRYSSLAKNPISGMKWAITYEDTANGDLKYAQETTGGVWSMAVVDDLMTGGSYSSLKFSGTTASVSYYDSYNANLRYATRSGGGTWSPETVASNGVVGLYTTLMFVSTTPVIVYYKSNTDELYEAYSTAPGAWTYITLEQGGGAGASAALTPGSTLGYTWYDTSEDKAQFIEN
jgi:subtilisin family serine protease